MEKRNVAKRGQQDSALVAVQPPDKVGWIRKFCGRGIFRELWKSRYVVLRGDHLYISEKEVKDERKAQEVLDLVNYERSEELRKAKSHSKKNHSRFTLLRCRQSGNTVHNLLFLAVSPEEKESWVNALNSAIFKAKNRILDEVTIEEDSVLIHPTRGRAKIPQSRRLPTRDHIHKAVASTLTEEEEEGDFSSPEYDSEAREAWEGVLEQGAGSRQGCRQRSGTDVSTLREASRKLRVETGSLPRGCGRSWGRSQHPEGPQAVLHTQQLQLGQAQSRTPQPGKRFSVQGRNRCASMDEVPSSRPVTVRSELCPTLHPNPKEDSSQSPAQPVGQLQSLIVQRMQRAQELLEEMRLQELQKAKADRGEHGGEGERGGDSPYLKGKSSPCLHYLRGVGSLHSRSSSSLRSRSSDSSRLRGKDSPRLRGRESPRVKAKRNRSKTSESPHSRGSKPTAPRLRDTPHQKDAAESVKETGSPNPRGPSSSLCSDQEVHSPKLSLNLKISVFPQSRATDTSALESHKELPSHASNKFPSLSKSFDSPQLRSFDSPLGKTTNQLPPQKSIDSSQPQTPEKHSPSRDSPYTSPLWLPSDGEVGRRRAEAERLLEEAVSSWKEAQEVLQEVKELQSLTMRRRRRGTCESPPLTATADEDSLASPEDRRPTK